MWAGHWSSICHRGFIRKLGSVHHMGPNHHLVSIHRLGSIWHSGSICHLSSIQAMQTYKYIQLNSGILIHSIKLSHFGNKPCTRRPFLRYSTTFRLYWVLHNTASNTSLHVKNIVFSIFWHISVSSNHFLEDLDFITLPPTLLCMSKMLYLACFGLCQ